MAGKIGKDFILDEDELKLLFQSAFVAGYQAERNQDAAKLGWDYACKAENDLAKKHIEQNFLQTRARYMSNGR